MTASMLAPLLLAGCAITPAPVGVAVQWVKTSGDELRRICMDKSSAVLVYGRINGCTVIMANGCTIYASDFSEADTAKMAVLGHELKHCFDKKWHEASQVRR